MATIEEELKQYGFKSEKHKAMLNLLFTSKWLEQSLNKALKKFNMNYDQLNVLRIIRGFQPVHPSVGDIRLQMVDKMANVSRLLDALQTKGMIDRELNEQDKRLIKIQLTPRGDSILQILDVHLAPLKDFPISISDEEASILNGILDRIRSN